MMSNKRFSISQIETPSQSELYEAKAYQKASLQYNKKDRPSFILSKQDRRFVAKQLERIANGNPERLARDMYRHRQDWKRLIKNVHIGDFKDCKATAEAFSMTSHNVSIDRHDKTVEQNRRAIPHPQGAKRVGGGQAPG